MQFWGFPSIWYYHPQLLIDASQWCTSTNWNGGFPLPSPPTQPNLPFHPPINFILFLSPPLLQKVQNTLKIIPEQFLLLPKSSQHIIQESFSTFFCAQFCRLPQSKCKNKTLFEISLILFQTYSYEKKMLKNNFYSENKQWEIFTVKPL